MKTQKILPLTILLIFSFASKKAVSQQSRIDSLFSNSDTTAVLDSLMKDFDSYLDSLTKPKSFFNVSISAGTGVFSFEDKNSVYFTNEKKIIFSPSAGYYHKSGLGFTATAYMINDDGKMNFYQYSLSPSFDVIKKSFSSGVSFTRYINKDSLDFYTTPIQNEVFAYFSYKKLWVRPSLSVSYGWGSKTEYEKRKYQIWSRLLQRSNDYYITVKNEETVSDLSVTLTVRKDFDWYDVIAEDDNVTITPVILLNSGTQKYGFNTSYTNTSPTPIRVNSTPSNSNISDKTKFAPQSLSMVLRGSYLKGKFLIQPQVLFDYYIPYTEDDRLNTVFAITAGLSF